MANKQTNTTTKDDCSTGSCPVVGADDNKTKLVKSSDLPLHGNPYPPKDVIQDETPGSLELTVRSVRTTLQPYMVPLCSAYQRSSEFVAVGASHTRSALSRLRDNQSSLVNALVISGSGLLGVALARRRSVFKKLLYGSVFVGGATVFCYPKETREKAELAFFIAKNRVPALMREQYQNLTGLKPTIVTSETQKKPDDGCQAK